MDHAQAALEALDTIRVSHNGAVRYAREHLREIISKLPPVAGTPPPLVFEKAVVKHHREVHGQPGVLITFDESGKEDGIHYTRGGGLPWLSMEERPLVPRYTVSVTNAAEAYLVEEISRRPGADWQVVEIRFRRGEPVRVYDRPIGSVAKALGLVEEE